MRAPAALLAALALVAGVACSEGGNGPAGGASQTVPPPAQDTGPPPVYVAVGASETAGIGAEQPLRDAWPRVLYRKAMTPETVFVNLGIPGATVAHVLARSAPQAVELRPTVVSVWLNVNDILAGVGPAEYERDLETLVRMLRRGGTTRVLVANTPPLDRLPAYLACRPDPPPAGPECRRDLELPPPVVVNALVDAYNAAIAGVAERQGALLVDLHAVGMAARDAGIEQALVSNDGFHPNSGGHAAVATAFAEVLRRNGG
jgi:lysophospholipase L1-like esterase